MVCGVSWCGSGHRSGDGGWWWSCGSGEEAWWSLQVGIEAELETTTKSENESENDHCCKNGGVYFAKNGHFQLILMFIFYFIFEKWKKNENWKWSKNGQKMATVNNSYIYRHIQSYTSKAFCNTDSLPRMIFCKQYHLIRTIVCKMTF